jgi:hypothetical protein
LFLDLDILSGIKDFFYCLRPRSGVSRLSLLGIGTCFEKVFWVLSRKITGRERIEIRWIFYLCGVGSGVQPEGGGRSKVDEGMGWNPFVGRGNWHAEQGQVQQ